MAALTLFAILGIGFATEGVAIDSNEMERFKNEYPAAAARLREQYKNVEVRVHRITHNLNGSTHEFDARLLLKGDRALSEATRKGKRGSLASRVFSFTPERVFRLGKTGPETPYVLEAQTSGESEEIESDTMFYVGKVLRGLYSLHGDDHASLIDNPTITIVGVRRGTGDDAERVIVAYRQKPVGDDSENHVSTGEVKLDPSLGWAIVSHKSRFPDESDGLARGPVAWMEFEVTIDVRREGDLIILERLVEQYGAPGTRGFSRDDARVVSAQFGKVTDDQFTLSAFGVPEVPLRPKPAARFFSLRNPLLWGSALVAVAAFLGLAVMRRRSMAGA